MPRKKQAKMPRKKPTKKAGRKKPKPRTLGEGFVAAELGNVKGVRPLGIDANAVIFRLVKRLPKAKFVGIDLAEVPQRAKKALPKNIRQVEANFSQGLKKFPDKHFDRIFSNMSLGHYNKQRVDIGDVPKNKKIRQQVKENTHETLKVAYRKLKKGGKLKITVGQPAFRLLMNAFKGTGFEKSKIRKRKRTRGLLSDSPWTEHYREGPDKKDVYTVIAIK